MGDSKQGGGQFGPGRGGAFGPRGMMTPQFGQRGAPGLGLPQSSQSPQANPALVGPQAPPHGDPRMIAAQPEPYSMGRMGMGVPHQQVDVGGGKMATQFGRDPNQFMWGGGQGTAPMLDALGNPVGANFMGNIGGRRWFNPSDGGGNSW